VELSSEFLIRGGRWAGLLRGRWILNFRDDVIFPLVTAIAGRHGREKGGEEKQGHAPNLASPTGDDEMS
jgi:hypothetical protein